VARPTGFEWGIVLTVTVVVGTLAVFYAVEWDRSSTEAAPEPVRVEVKAATTPGAALPPRPVVSTPVSTSKPRATFVFTAARGDSWFQARAGSFGGRVLYEGNLSEGETVRLRSRRLWIRFGGASDIDLRIDGRPVRLPAFGTYDAFAGPRGVVADRKIYATAAQSP
jgi:hypothetical protein